VEEKDQIISSPLALGLIGGALGAAIGGSIARGQRTSPSNRRPPWERGYRPGARRRAESESFTELGEERYAWRSPPKSRVMRAISSVERATSSLALYPLLRSSL
jgi:hypothetical protein